MQSPDTSSESRSPLTSRDGPSAVTSLPDSANNPMARAIHLAVRQCVAQEHDGIETLRRCVRAARADGAKPEHVVLLVHSAWDECAGHAGASGEHDIKRLRLTGAALDAYFADD
jgi:hypothetical protein